MNDEERARALCDISHLNFKMFKSPEEIDKMIDLSGEGYQFVRIVEQENGRKEVLRLFNDNERHPREGEITATLKRFVAKAPWSHFLRDMDHVVLIITEDGVIICLPEICGSDIRC